MRWFNRFIIVLFFIALVVAAIKLVHMRKQELRSVQPAQRPAMVVNTAQVREEDLQITQTYRGIVRPERTVALTPRIQGRIGDMDGEAGDRIQPGQTLVRIDDREIQQEIASLQAEKERIESRIWILQKTYERQEKLVKQGNISQDVFDQNTSNLQQARADLRKLGHQIQQAGTRLDYSRLDADINGHIQRRLQEPGDMAQPGKPVMLLEDASAGYNVHIRIPAQVQTLIYPGQEVVLISGDDKLKASINRLHPAVARGSSLIEAEIFLDHSPFGLPSGASLQVELLVSQVSGLLVPARAILRQDQGDLIFSVDADKKITSHKVEVLAQTSDQAAVQGDLQAGQSVVVGPLSQLMRLGPDMKVDVAGEPVP